MKTLFAATLGFVLVNVVAALLLIPIVFLAQRVLATLTSVDEGFAALVAVAVFVSGVVLAWWGAGKVRVVFMRHRAGK